MVAGGMVHLREGRGRALSISLSMPIPSQPRGEVLQTPTLHTPAAAGPAEEMWGLEGGISGRESRWRPSCLCLAYLYL